VNDENGEIALCTLSAFNLGVIDSLDELEELAVLAVRALDALLDYQDYPIPAAKRGAMGRRTLGIGVINFAYYLAKHGKRYSDGSANNLTHKTFEAIQYYLLKASNELAIEQGACPWFNETTYAKGILPIDTYKKDLDASSANPCITTGKRFASPSKRTVRNSTLSALMPSETSSQISNATNGIEPPRGHVSIKASKDGILRQVVPDYEKLQNGYELLWEMPNNDGYLQLVGIMQKFIDQSISANTNYDPTRFPSGKVPMQQLLKDLLNAYKFGVKTLYYHNTRDGAEDAQDDLAPSIQDDGCESGACKI
jgi:ribonucleoside-diphosphate reductase alpha chain